MKYGVYIALIILVLSAGCTKKVYTSSIYNIPETEEGTIFLRVTGFGSNKQEAYNKAVSNAFNTLLYKGIPESIQSRPMIEDEAKAKEKFSDVLSCFNRRECYSQFITQNNDNGNTTRVKGGTTTAAEVKINIRALRTYLEQKQVIRKFGF